jgi:hypothetical protein
MIVIPRSADAQTGRKAFSVLICHEARNACAYSSLQCKGKHSALDGQVIRFNASVTYKKMTD